MRQASRALRTTTSLGLILASVVVVWAMLFRGFLFRSLYSSGRRQRVFEARARGL